MPRFSTEGRRMTFIISIIAWYIIGIIATTIFHYVIPYYEKETVTITIAAILFSLLVSLLGPIMILIAALNYIMDNNLLGKTIFRFKKPPYKGDK